MRYRNLRMLSTGQWINWLFTEDADTREPFNMPAASALEDVARALSVATTELEVVDSGGDQRTGALLEMPLPPITQPTRTDELLAIPRSGWTAAQVRELLQLTAQKLSEMTRSA